MRYINRIPATALVLAAFAQAAQFDSTAVIPIGEWNMNTEPMKEVDLSGLNAGYADILDIQVAIRTDFPDGQDESTNNASIDRIDRFPVAGQGFEGKGGTYYVQPVGGQLKLRLFADRGPLNSSAGTGFRIFRTSPEYTRKYYYNSRGWYTSFNRGFVLVHFRGLQTGGVSTNALNQRHYLRSVSFPAGNLNLGAAAFPAQQGHLEYGLWEHDINPTRILGFNWAIHSNPVDGTRKIQSMNRKLGILDALSEKPAHIILRTSGGSYLDVHAGIYGHGASAFSHNTLYSGTSNNRGHFYLNHYAASCDDYVFANNDFTFTSIPANNWNEYACAGRSNNGYFVMQTKGWDIGYQSSDDANMAYYTLSGDRTIQARIDFVEKTNGWAKFGPMFRQSLAGNSRFVGIFYTPDGGLMLHWRKSDGAMAGRQPANTIKAPVWTKLVKSGNTYTATYSTNNGATWTTLGSTTLDAPLGANYLAGLAGTSRSDYGAASTAGAYGLSVW